MTATFLRFRYHNNWIRCVHKHRSMGSLHLHHKISSPPTKKSLKLLASDLRHSFSIIVQSKATSFATTPLPPLRLRSLGNISSINIHFRNRTPLITSAAANFTCGELATALRKVNHLDKGINPSSLRLIYVSGDYLPKGIRIGIVSCMIALTESVAVGRSFAAKKDYQIDGNKETVALGAMNVIATGSFSRSAVNFVAGCQTAVSNIIMSMVVLLTLLFLTPLFKYTPNAILAAIIIINAVIPLVDVNAAVSFKNLVGLIKGQ
ncbi:SLC26A/SulP transporter protein [Raphanus sativus]|nr:SLC26A/SulP transporter protein [Raphanus sativus]